MTSVTGIVYYIICMTVPGSVILCNIRNMTLPLPLNSHCKTGNPANSFHVAMNRHDSLPENVSYVASNHNHCSEVCATEDDDGGIFKGNVYETDYVIDTKSFFDDLTLPPRVPERKYLGEKLVSHH